MWKETASFMGWGCNACLWKHRLPHDVATLIAPSPEVQRAFNQHTCESVTSTPTLPSAMRTLEKKACDSTLISAIVSRIEKEISRTRAEIDALRTVIPLLEDHAASPNDTLSRGENDGKSAFLDRRSPNRAG